MLLAIETATQQLGVAVVDGERLLASFDLLAEHPHAVELPGAVSRALQAAHVTLPQLAAIAVDVGPGSFTGLRIGMAFAKALAFTHKTPMVGVPSLDVLAAQVPFSPDPVCALLDARRRNLYAACYDTPNGSARSGYRLAPIDEVLQEVSGPAVFVGDGAALYRQQILERYPQARFAPEELWRPHAATLARLAQARFERGQRDDPATLTPMYLYAQTCQINPTVSTRAAGAPRTPLVL